jgi:hypothetical protein
MFFVPFVCEPPPDDDLEEEFLEDPPSFLMGGNEEALVLPGKRIGRRRMSDWVIPLSCSRSCLGTAMARMSFSLSNLKMQGGG